MRDLPIKTYERWLEDESRPRAVSVLRKFVLKEDFDIVAEAYREMEIKYHERGAAMRETGEMVRSLFIPYINRIAEAVRNSGQHSDYTITEIQDILDELNKHTPIRLVL